MDNSTVVAYINKQGGTRGGDMHSPMEDHDLCHHYQITLNARRIHRVSECDGRPSVQVKPSSINRMVTASAGVQQICLTGSPLK